MQTAEAPTTVEGITDDTLDHVFCTVCERRAKSRAKKPVPFCGKQKEGSWSDGLNPEGQVCQMCILIMNEGPCKGCGIRSRV